MKKILVEFCIAIFVDLHFSVMYALLDTIAEHITSN